MKKSLLLLLIIIALGCSPNNRPQPVVVEKRVATIPVYHPPLPEGVRLSPVKWKVFTPVLMEDYLKALSKSEASVQVWYAVTPKTYEALANNVEEMKRYIRQMQALLKYYRDNVKEQVMPEDENDQTAD